MDNNYTITVDLSAFDEARVVTNGDGDRILLLNLDRTPGIRSTASGRYYLTLVAFTMREKGPYGATHAIARYVTRRMRRLFGRPEYPLVGNMCPFIPPKRTRDTDENDLMGVDASLTENWDTEKDESKQMY